MSTVTSVALVASASCNGGVKPDTPAGSQSFGQVLSQQVDGNGESPEQLQQSALAASDAPSSPPDAGKKQTVPATDTPPGNPSASTKTRPNSSGTKTQDKAVAEDSTVSAAGKEILPSASMESLLAAKIPAASSQKTADEPVGPETTQAREDNSQSKKAHAGGVTSVLPNMVMTTPFAPVPSGQDAASTPLPEKVRTPATASAERSIASAVAGRASRLPEADPTKLETKVDQPSSSAKQSITGAPEPSTTTTNFHPSPAPLFSVVLQQADASAGFSQAKTKLADVLPNTAALATLLPISSSTSVALTNTTAVPTAQLQLSPAVQDQPVWGDALGQSVQWMAQGGIQQALIHLHPQHLGPLVVQLGVSQNGQASAVFLSEHPEVRAAISAALPQLQQSFAALGLNLAQSNVGSGSSGMAQNRRENADRDADAPSGVEEISSLQPATSRQMHRGLLSTFV